jgi:hypothetical protein
MHVVLAPDHVSYRFQSPYQRRASEKGTVACSTDPDGPPWRAACAALKGIIEESMRSRLRLEVVVSDRLMRYQVLPWQPGIVSRAEWRAYALNTLIAAYGDTVRSWSLRIEVVPPKRESLACALDTGMIDELRSLAVDSLSRLVSVRPNLITRFGQRRTAMQGSRFWFGVLEDKHICLGVVRKGRWEAVRNEAAPDGWQAALPGLVRRMQASLDAACDGTLYLSGDVADDTMLPQVDGLSVRLFGARTPRRTEDDCAEAAGA